MNELRSLLWVMVMSVVGAGCGPVAIRALDPGADGGSTSDVVSVADSNTPTRCAMNSDCRTGEYCAGNGCGTVGSCAPKPQGCTADYTPVCGCDGRTYSNVCGAAAAGVRVASPGECGVVDAGVDGGGERCATNDDCGPRRYCAGNGCGTPGYCAPRTEACPEIYSPVCGCDRQTYGNACEAAGAGVRVAATGVCPSQDAGVDAGPSACASNRDCAAGSYCAGDGCGTRGTCRAMPQACDLIYAPVCGCDGRTHSNECAAAAAGVRVASSGMCGDVDSGVRACASSSDCASDGRECVFPEGVCAARGVCELPTPCFRPETWCGCDGETYESCRPTRPTQRMGACGGNDAGTAQCTTSRDCGTNQTCVYPDGACVRGGTCQATIQCFRPEPFCSCAGETYLGCVPERPTQHRGECAPRPDAGASRCAAILCGPGFACCEATGSCYDTRCLSCCMPQADAGAPTSCASNDDCARDSYCEAATCGGRGRCAPRPQVCPGIYAPVCGCDGRTYSSDCIAASQGVSVARVGECR